MDREYLKKYDDFIMAYARLYHIQWNQSNEELLNLISNILIDKYKVSLTKISVCIIRAMEHNFRYVEQYENLIDQINAKYSINLKELYEDSDDLSLLDNSPHLTLQFKRDFIHNIIKRDEIDNFREYIAQNSINSIKLIDFVFNQLTLIEVCAYYGSVNIFYFILSNFGFEITQKCLELSVIGGNIDIMNECLKYHKINRSCLMNAINSHNNRFLDYIFHNDLIDSDLLLSLQQHQFLEIIKSQNLKIVFLLLERDIDLIVPWCVGFPQCLEILKNEKYDFRKVCKEKWSLLHYAINYNNIEICEYLLSSKEICQSLINAPNSLEMTPLDLAYENDSFEIAQLLASHNAKSDYANSSEYDYNDYYESSSDNKKAINSQHGKYSSDLCSPLEINTHEYSFHNYQQI